MNDRSLISNYLLSALSKYTNPENTSQFKLVKDSRSNRINDLLIHNKTPVILCNDLLTILDTDKQFELKGDLLKTITDKNYNVDLVKIRDKKLMFDFAKAVYSIRKLQAMKDLGTDLLEYYLNHLVYWFLLPVFHCLTK